MPTFNLSLLVLTLALVGLGGWSMFLARSDESQKRAKVGRWMFTMSLTALGLAAVLAALLRADALAPMGVLSGLLVTGMLWETPAPRG